jgi:uncharacterized MAPEG superfamily protein
MQSYSTAILGLLLLCLLPVILANIAGPLKGKSGLIGGPVKDARDENLLFRIDRAHGNSVESIPPFLVPAILAMLVGVDPQLLAGLAWTFLAIRAAYAIIYVRGGPLAKGGSLRTILHVLGSLTTVALIVVVAVSAFGG